VKTGFRPILKALVDAPKVDSVRSNLLIGDEMQEFTNFHAIGENLKSAYRAAHGQYRRDDELEVGTENHRRVSVVLKRICSSYPRPISVLDAGCGTGRYFYCLNNVARLVGIDLSPDMLASARTPVRQKEISVSQIELVCANIYSVRFPPQSLEFIYSVGMFGHGCPVTVELCNKFYHWLAIGGKLFFTVVDQATLPLLTRLRRQLCRAVSSWLPRDWQRELQARESSLPFFGLTKSKLETILRASRFDEFAVSRHRWRSPLWKGVHLECTALKRG
jgi:SAM-dependent methyltransferase